MNTDLSAHRPRLFRPKLLWSAAGLLAFALGSFALSIPATKSVVEGAGTRPMMTPAVTEPNRIDHSEIDWQKLPAEPDPAGASVAAYGFGA